MKKFISILFLILFCFNYPYVISYADENELSMDDFYSQVDVLVGKYDNDDGLASENSKTIITNRLIVKTYTNAPLQNYFGASAVVEGYDCLHFLQYTSEEEAEYAYKKFSFQDIEYVEYDFYMEFSSESTPKILEDTNEHISWNSDAVQVDDAFEYIKKNNIECSEIRVAVIDTGVYKAHEFFKCTENCIEAGLECCSEECLDGCSSVCSDNCMNCRIIDSGYTYDVIATDESDNDHIINYPSTEDNMFHGTFVAGVLFDNSMNNVKIVPFRITNSLKTPYSKVLHAFDKILEINSNETTEDDIDIVNMSFENGLDYSNMDCYTLNDKMSQAAQDGMIIIAAAGNRGKLTDKVFPACQPDAITVSNTDEYCVPAKISNYGVAVDIAAPGTNITSPTPRTFVDEDKSEIEVCDAYNAYMTDSGTSFATPLVAAAAATLKSIVPDITPAEVKRIIKETAYVPDDWEESCDGKNYGTGIVNFYNMVKAVLEPEYSAMPTISVNSDNKFEITAPEGTDSRIYYTLDGTVPTIENHLIYTEPLNLRNKYATKITAVCHENRKLIGEPTVYDMITYDEKTVFYKWSDTLYTDVDTENANWKSYNPDIAAVDSNGKITGVSRGDTKITCTLPTGERIICKVNVEYSPLQAFFVLFFFGFLWI